MSEFSEFADISASFQEYDVRHLPWGWLKKRTLASIKVPRRDAGETEFCVTHYNYYSFVLSGRHRMRHHLARLASQFREQVQLNQLVNIP
jgi:hypothetical protein